MTAHWVIYREHVKHNGVKVKKFLRRPTGVGNRWSWAERQVGAAWFHDLVQAEAYAKDYEGAQVLYVER
jgi:hypothetical protein